METKKQPMGCFSISIQVQERPALCQKRTFNDIDFHKNKVSTIVWRIQTTNRLVAADGVISSY